MTRSRCSPSRSNTASGEPVARAAVDATAGNVATRARALRRLGWDIASQQGERRADSCYGRNRSSAPRWLGCGWPSPGPWLPPRVGAPMANGTFAIGPFAPAEERQQRKRRLLKGPKEFRDLRDEIRSK